MVLLRETAGAEREEFLWEGRLRIAVHHGRRRDVVVVVVDARGRCLQRARLIVIIIITSTPLRRLVSPTIVSCCWWSAGAGDGDGELRGTEELELAAGDLLRGGPQRLT